VNRKILVGMITCSLMPLAAVHSAEDPGVGLDYILRAGLAYTDNVFMQPSPFEEDASSVAVGAEVRGERTTGRLQYKAAVELMHFEYLDTYSGGETFGRGLLDGSYAFVPDHFRWNAAFGFDQLRGDPFRPIGPGNVDDSFTVSTGPTVRGDLFGAVDTQVDAHYIRTFYTGDAFDNQTIGGRLAIGRRTGPQSRFGLGGSLDDVSYLGAANGALDFERREVFVYGDMNGARTQMSGEFGYSEANGDSVDADGPIARVQLTRKMSPALSAYLRYQHEFPTSQAGIALTDPTFSGGGVIDTSLLLTSPREAYSGEFGFNYVRTRSEGNIGLYHLDEESLIAGLGGHRYDELRARVTREFTPLSHGTIYIAYSMEDFSAFDEEFDELRAGFEFGREFTRTIGLDLRINYRSRDGNGSSPNFDELSGGVYIRYTGSLLGRNSGTPQESPGR
jgi:hypothetical protein